MPRIFSYPVSMQPLILTAVLAVVSMLLSGPGIFSALLKGVMWLILVKYSFESLKATAGGKLDAKFLPAAEPLFKLAGWLNETGKTKAAVAVYNLIGKSY